jgi:hypothetical protein
MSPPRTGADVALAVNLFIVAAITCLYWTVWYLVPDGETMLSVLPGDPAHKRFEDAFLVADLWMAFACVMGALRLLGTPSRAVGWLYMAGSAGLYLAGMDILYDVQNNIYAMFADPARREAVVTESLINLGTIGFSLWAILRANRLLAPPEAR